MGWAPIGNVLRQRGVLRPCRLHNYWTTELSSRWRKRELIPTGPLLSSWYFASYKSHCAFYNDIARPLDKLCLLKWVTATDRLSDTSTLAEQTGREKLDTQRKFIKLIAKSLSITTPRAQTTPTDPPRASCNGVHQRHRESDSFISHFTFAQALTGAGVVTMPYLRWKWILIE